MSSQSPTPAGDSGYSGRERGESSNGSIPSDTTPEVAETDNEIWAPGKRRRTIMSTVEVNVPSKRAKTAITTRATETANGKGKGKKASQSAAKYAIPEEPAVPADLGDVVAPEGLEEMTEAVDNADLLDEEEEQNLTVVRNVTESCFLKGVAIPRLIFPKSQYEGFDFGMPIEKETEVLKQLLKAEADGAGDVTTSEGDFSCFSLDRFTIYYPTRKRLSGEMTLLSNLNVHRGDNLLLFDGVLSDDAGESRYVEGVAFSILSVGNYENKESHDVSGKIWIQTPGAKDNNTWYELKNPSDEYSEYWEAFVWLANLSKHAIDFMVEKKKEKGGVVLLDFKSDFIDWLRVHHSESGDFQKWHAAYGKDDFRQAIAAHRDWLWNQVFNGSTGLNKCKLWEEVRYLSAVKPVSGTVERKTVVTPWVHECFDHMFGENLKKVVPTPKDIGATLEAVVIPIASRMKRDRTGNILRTKVTSVEPGTVVALKREGTEWSGRTMVWYAYVHGVDDRGDDKPDLGPELKVIWLYAHEDTILAKGKYPHHNEVR